MKRHPLIVRVEEYVALRHSQGYGFRPQADVLLGFARFAERIGHEGPLTVDLAVRWARTPRRATVADPARRLGYLRPFARHLAAIDPASETLPVGLLRERPTATRTTPRLPSTPLAARVQQYVALRRNLGYQITAQAKLLLSFARFAESDGHVGPVTIDLAVRFARATISQDPSQATRRLQVLRGLARYLTAFEPETEVPPKGLLGHPTRRKAPHVYSDAEIAALLGGAAALRPRGGLRPRTYVTLFALLFSTGLRLGEALRLRSRDVDLDAGILTVHQTKFGKSRLVPLHESALEPLRRYGQHRDACPHAPRSESFFRTDHAPCLTGHAVDVTFRRLRQRLGWTAEGRARRPRIHDARHTFVTSRLLRWAEQDVDADQRMYHLATYLGHADVAGTYWYLSAVPELMALTAGRFEEFVGREQEHTS